LNLSIVDPCCGVGTIVIEAASMGLDIKGYEINRKVAASAKENLAFFGVDNAIECSDMHHIQRHFDTSIVDMPYGLFTAVSMDEQIEIIRTARRISDKSVIITFENMEKQITDNGFTVTDRCLASKGRFTRHITVCE
jgi:tRNA G10  N-methylase Trm11